jgi:competence protein ComEA
VFEFTGGQKVALGTLLVAALLAGGLWLYQLGRHHEPQAAPLADVVPPDTAAQAVLVVQVAGAVHKPGLYRLDANARVDDALSAAGGVLDGARVADINLAARLKDGMRLYVPAKDDPAPEKTVVVTEDVYVRDPPQESAPTQAPPPPGQTIVAGNTSRAAAGAAAGHASSRGKKEPPAQPIDLNRAGLAELQRLPRIGPTLAARIVGDRATHGPFRSVDDLARVKGIGKATLEKLRPYLVVN